MRITKIAVHTMKHRNKPYSHPREHMEQELARIELLVRAVNGEDVQEQVQALEKSIVGGIKAALTADQHLPLEVLKASCKLSTLETDALLLVAGASLSPALAGLYAGLRSNPLQGSPTLEFIAKVLALSQQEATQLLDFLLSPTPLRRFHLFGLSQPHMENAEPLMTVPLNCHYRLLTFLLGNESLTPSLNAYMSFPSARLSLEDLPVARESRTALDAVRTTFMDKGIASCREMVFHFRGPAGVGKKEIAAALCASAGVSALYVDLAAAMNAGVEPRALIDNVCREAFLRGAAPVISNWQITDTLEGNADWRHAFLHRASELPLPVFVASSPTTDFDFGKKDRLLEIEIQRPPRSVRRKIWSNYLNGMQVAEVFSPDHLAGAFSFTPGQIQSAFEYARNREELLHGSPQISEKELLAGCRAMSNRNLSKLALRVEHRFAWKDLILPDETMEQLQDIPGHLRYGRIVHDEWRMDSKSTGGRGLNALFSGPSGTGKTMAAGIIAADLKLEMYRVDLSSIISKYVGETEKNLGKIFAEAEGSNAILFFDEADSLFGKRGDVKDAHDRYANTEVNYLLQKMEDFHGITILATNLRENIDEAFLRRLHFIVEFPFPDERERTRIWRNVFTENTPLEKNVDTDFLGKYLRVPGGNIISIARNAAFLAAADNRPVGMNQILRAAKREFEKEGRPFIPAELGKYREYLQL